VSLGFRGFKGFKGFASTAHELEVIGWNVIVEILLSVSVLLNPLNPLNPKTPPEAPRWGFALAVPVTAKKRPQPEPRTTSPLFSGGK